MKKLTRSLPLLGILIWAVGCTSLTSSFTGVTESAGIDWGEIVELSDAVSRSVAFTPPPEYARVWEQVHADLGRPVGDLSRIEWRFLPAQTCLRGDGTEEAPCTRGLTVLPTVVVLSEDAVRDLGTVRHEMGHVVLGMLQRHDHPFFLTACSDRAATCGEI